MKHELTIVHRVCPMLSNTAYGYTDKFSMVKACASSMYEALKDIDYRMVVILDGCDSSYESIFEGAEIVHTDSIGNQKTFAKQLEILSDVDSPFVYVSEDDYLYKPMAFQAMLEFLKGEGKRGFVTPIDHPDRYNGTVTEPSSSVIRTSRFCHWRECGTTCLTFMSSSEVFNKCVPVFQAYVKGEQDSVTWLGVTKYGIFSPNVMVSSVISLIGRMAGKKIWFGRFIPLMAWVCHNVGLFWRKRYRLWSPMPSLAFHLSSNTIPPASSGNPSSFVTEK